MTSKLVTLIVVAALLGGCGAVRDSRVNPFNWFGGSRDVPASTPAATTEQSNALVPRNAGRRGLFSRPDEDYAGVLVERVTELSVEPTLGGAIIRVTGVASRLGAYGVRLTPANAEEVPENGILSYRLNVIYPEVATGAGTEAARQVVAARSLTREQLAGVSVIRIEADQNARETRRR